MVKNIWKGVSGKEYMKVIKWVSHNPKKWDKAYSMGTKIQKKLISNVLKGKKVSLTNLRKK